MYTHCRNFTGVAFPEDFCLPDKLLLGLALESKKWVVDYWVGDPRPDKFEYRCVYYVMPARNTDRNSATPLACIFFDGKACTLSEVRRPKQCRFIDSDEPEKDINVRAAAIAWLPYQDMLSRFVQCGTF